ncbi:hypothetical protein [Bdellovibrio sp. HCB274]|uniref:hypothetical protein n=1 Tax=Bdellovibrio sp. HCB274 TaxID=3394361 RepID=UPI0039B4E02E
MCIELETGILKVFTGEIEMFDTLMYAKRLEAAGMSREQAEAQVNIIAEMVVDGVATKQDLALMKAEISKELTDVRAEMAKGLADVRSEIHNESTRNLKIMGAMMVTSTTFTIAVLDLLLK